MMNKVKIILVLLTSLGLTLGGGYVGFTNFANDVVRVNIVSINPVQVELTSQIHNPFPMEFSIDLDVNIYMNELFIDRIVITRIIPETSWTNITISIPIPLELLEKGLENIEFKIDGVITLGVVVAGISMKANHKLS